MKHACAALSSLILTTLFLFSCTVYKSSDRDGFDANGKAQAPVQKPNAVNGTDADKVPSDKVPSTDICRRISVVINPDGDLYELLDDDQSAEAICRDQPNRRSRSVVN